MVDWDPFADPAEDASVPKENLLAAEPEPASTWNTTPETEEEMMIALAGAFGLNEEPKAPCTAAFDPPHGPRASVSIVDLLEGGGGPVAARSSNWQAGVLPSGVRISIPHKLTESAGSRSSGARPNHEGSREHVALERTLQATAGDIYNPAVMAKRRRGPPKSGRVSVVTPTSDRRMDFHEHLWTMFQGQRWTDKELIVVETYETAPSTFFTKLEHQHSELVLVQLRGKLTTGMKRNVGVHLASGAVIVNFDDDDVYAPEYLEVMVGHMIRENLVALTLSTWYDFDLRDYSCGFVDPEAAHELDLLHADRCELDSWKNSAEFAEIRHEYVSRSVYGYGFSFVHLREVATQYPYPNKSFGEDLPFMQQLRSAFDGRVGLLRDECGLVLHLMHGGNTADSAVHFRLSHKHMGGLAVSSLDHVKPLIAECERRQVLNEFGNGFQRIGKFRASHWDKFEVRDSQRDRANRLLTWLRLRAAQRREASASGEEPPAKFVEL